LTGSLSALGVGQAQGTLAHPQFGTAPQSLQPLPALQEGMLKLG
jgi:hypothetical protein